MTKDEALNLALEALESGDGWRQSEAITALRTAIEQAEKQEPVAYVVTTEVHGQMCSFIHRIDLTKLLPDGTKLYTTPPQRKPLTDDEIESINVRLAGKRDLARLFARAIEAAHGIKGDA